MTKKLNKTVDEFKKRTYNNKKTKNITKEKGMRKSNANGITLIALVVTIVVLLILAGISISMLTSDNGIITKASTAKVATELTGIKEEIQIKQVEEEKRNESLRYMTVKEANEKLKDIPEEYKGKIGLYREEPIYLGNEEDEIAKIAKNYGYRIINMTEEEFSYYIELGIVEDKVIENKENTIGRELATSDFPRTITIGNNTYSNGWYIIGNYTEEEKANNTYGAQFEELGIKDRTHQPYIVNYETGSIFSVDGMIMYQAEIPVHTFQDNNFKLTNAITYVGDTSTKTGDYYGNLYAEGSGSFYSDNGGKLQYDENGALILDEDNAIPVLDIDEKYQIGDSYSVNITAEGDIYDGADNRFSKSIIAMSDNGGAYICWVGVYEGFLHVYAYKSGVEENINYETEKDGFASIDISEYEGQVMNIQVIAQRGKETKVYINGKLIKTFKSGDNVYTYKHLTIGDLRRWRNLKFTGKIYNFAIYGVALNESEVQENYEEAKKYGIE